MIELSQTTPTNGDAYRTENKTNCVFLTKVHVIKILTFLKKKIFRYIEFELFSTIIQAEWYILFYKQLKTIKTSYI